MSVFDVLKDKARGVYGDAQSVMADLRRTLESSITTQDETISELLDVVANDENQAAAIINDKIVEISATSFRFDTEPKIEEGVSVNYLVIYQYNEDTKTYSKVGEVKQSDIDVNFTFTDIDGNVQSMANIIKQASEDEKLNEAIATIAQGYEKVSSMDMETIRANIDAIKITSNDAIDEFQQDLADKAIDGKVSVQSYISLIKQYANEALNITSKEDKVERLEALDTSSTVVRSFMGTCLANAGQIISVVLAVVSTMLTKVLKIIGYAVAAIGYLLSKAAQLAVDTNYQIDTKCGNRLLQYPLTAKTFAYSTLSSIGINEPCVITSPGRRTYVWPSTNEDKAPFNVNEYISLDYDPVRIANLFRNYSINQGQTPTADVSNGIFDTTWKIDNVYLYLPTMWQWTKEELSGCIMTADDVAMHLTDPNYWAAAIAINYLLDYYISGTLFNVVNWEVGGGENVGISMHFEQYTLEIGKARDSLITRAMSILIILMAKQSVDAINTNGADTFASTMAEYMGNEISYTSNVIADGHSDSDIFWLNDSNGNKLYGICASHGFGLSTDAKHGRAGVYKVINKTGTTLPVQYLSNYGPIGRLLYATETQIDGWYYSCDLVQGGPADFFISWPNYTRSGLIASLVVIGLSIAAVAITAKVVSKKLKAKRTKKKVQQLGKLNSLKEKYDSNPTDENYKAYAKAAKRYNFKAKIFGWDSYDMYNGWLNASSDDASGSGSILDPIKNVLNTAEENNIEQTDNAQSIISLIKG